MRKTLATIFLIIYFTASAGATVNIHYCMGQLQSMDLWHSKEKKEVCVKCGMTNKKGCCEEKHEVVKIEKKYIIPPAGVSATKISNLPAQYYIVDETLKPTDEILKYPASNSPPGKEYILLFSRNSAFRI